MVLLLLLLLLLLEREELRHEVSHIPPRPVHKLGPLCLHPDSHHFIHPSLPCWAESQCKRVLVLFSEVFLLFACLWCIISCQLRRKRKEDHDFPRAAQVELVHLEPSQRQRGGGRAEEDRKKVLPPPESASDGPPEQGRQCMQMAIPIRNEV